MKSHYDPSLVQEDFRGMNTADPADRIDPAYSSLLRNGYCNQDGRIVKARGVTIAATGASLRLTTASARTKVWSMFPYEGRVGEFPNSRLLVTVGGSLLRSKANDISSAMDVVTFDSEITAPSFNRPSAGPFRDQYFYHQNGFDVPFRVRCENDDTTEPTVVADTLGLRPPAACFQFLTFTPGNARRFPPNVSTSYCVTFVYGNSGNRGESGPSVVMSLLPVTGDGTNDKVNFTNVPLGPTGCTERRIYRSYIGKGQAATSGGTSVAKSILEGPTVEMFLIARIKDNTTVAWTDQYDDAALVKTQRCPPPRPFPYRARYQALHLDRLFGANVKEHQWTIGVSADLNRAATAPFTDYRVTISNTGAGTITFEKNNAGWTTDFAIASYTTLSLKTILASILSSASTSLAAGAFSGALTCNIQAGLDLERKYKFKEVSQRSIYASSDVYWFFALDDQTNIDGPRAYPNRCVWMDLTFPEQGNPFNGTDLTRYGSKRISGLLALDNSLCLQTDTDTYFLAGDFVPNNLGVPNFSVNRSQASHGSICQRPDATATMPDLGTGCIAHDGIRVFRGESSTLGGMEVKDQLARLFREPVARDQVSTIYHAGEWLIALPTDDVP